MKYGMTGTRNGMTPLQKDIFLQALLKQPKLDHLVHGDCIGADFDAHKLSRSLSHTVTVRPCDLSDQRAFCNADIEHPTKKPLQRNADIVNEVRVMFAFPGELKEQLRSGTWATIRLARKSGKLLYIIYPDGSVESCGSQA
jgi:hypothetical protein